jgi:predicted Zn-dependent protease
MKKALIIGCFSATFLLFNSCARNPVTGKRQVVLMSEEQEIAMGKEADPQIIAQYGLYENAALQSYFTQKGKEIAATSHRTNLDYQFRLLDSDVVNAFAVPGGYIYFTRGIMAHFNSEAQLTGVLGHEIGHVAARHSVEQQRNQLLGQLGIIAGVVIAPQLAQFAEAASQGLGLLFLKFSRDAEREADRLGVEYSEKLGYDAHRMADFFNTLKRQGEQSESAELPNFLSTHPDPGERFTTVNELATEWQRKLNLTNPKVVRDDYLRRIDGLVYGEDPKQGFRENNVFYHPVLKFQFATPTGWAYQNAPTQVQLSEPNGKALLIFTLAPGSSLEQAASAALQKYSLRTVESRQTTVSGFPALAVVADQVTQQQPQPTVRTLNYFIQQGGNIYHMIGVSGINDFNAYMNLFTSSMQSFREVTDPNILNRQPDRVRIKTVASATTLQQAFRNLRVPDNRMQEFAILNGMNLTDQVPAGTLIKVVER